MSIKQIIIGLVVSVSLASGLGISTASASKSNQIDDAIFYNKNAMSESDIANFIASRPSSCLLPSNYPGGLSSVTFKEPLSYFDYGSAASPARVIWKASQFYNLNPQVILTTLEKESNLVSGNAGCPTWRYNSAMGYNCPTGAEEFLKDYPSIGITGTCVQKESNAGFSRQVNHAAWQLSFDGKRANGDLSWMGDGDTYYYGRMTQGNRSRVNGGAQSYYDGYTTINGEAVYMSNGPTAALYNYTPFFSNFETIFTNWFGSSHMPVYGADIQSVENYTDNSKSVATPATPLVATTRTYMVLKFKNTGTNAWKNSGSGAVRLAVLNVSSSSFCDSTWISCDRPAELKEATVNPGEVGTFEFWYKAPGVGSDTSFQTRFGVISEAVATMTGAQQVQTTLVERANYSASYQSVENYTDNSKSVATPATPLVANTRTYMVLKFKNEGNITWRNSGTGAVRVAILSGNSAFCDGTWLSCARPAEMKESSVAPGQTATFEFWYNTPSPQSNTSYQTRFGLVSEAVATMTGTQQVQTTSVQKANYDAIYQSVENYTDASKGTSIPAASLASNQRTYMVLKFKNNGNIAWKNSGSGAVRLATLSGKSAFCDGTWLSCQRPAEMKETVVNPGEVGTFEFWYKAPGVGSTVSYQTRFGLVSEAVATMTGTQQVQTTSVHP